MGDKNNNNYNKSNKIIIKQQYIYLITSLAFFFFKIIFILTDIFHCVATAKKVKEDNEKMNKLKTVISHMI